MLLSFDAATELAASYGSRAGADPIIAAWLSRLQTTGALKSLPPMTDKAKEHFFDFQEWESHRSTGRYFRHLSTMYTSRTVQKLLAPVTFSLIETVLLASYEAFHPEGWPAVPHIGGSFFDLTSQALALLLVFRCWHHRLMRPISSLADARMLLISENDLWSDKIA